MYNHKTELDIKIIMYLSTLIYGTNKNYEKITLYHPLKVYL